MRESGVGAAVGSGVATVGVEVGVATTVGVGVAAGVDAGVDGPSQAKDKATAPHSATTQINHCSFRLRPKRANTLIAKIPLFAEKMCYLDSLALACQPLVRIWVRLAECAIPGPGCAGSGNPSG